MHEFFHPKCCLLSWYPVDNHPKYSNSSMAAIERFSLQLRFLLVFAFLNSHHALNPESNRDSLACRRFPVLSLLINPLQIQHSTVFKPARLFFVFFILRDFQEKSWVDIEFRGNKTHWFGRPKGRLFNAISCFISGRLQLKEEPRACLTIDPDLGNG